MTSAKQIAANRRNAKASTGPRTRAGKARSRRTALRHGLAAVLPPDPETEADIAALAMGFLGDEATPLARLLAREAAEAELQLMRARAVRTHLLDAALSETRGRPFEPGPPATFMRGGPATDSEGSVMGRIARVLTRLDRYERRALSRRRRALRELDRARISHF